MNLDADDIEKIGQAIDDRLQPIRDDLSDLKTAVRGSDDVAGSGLQSRVSEVEREIQPIQIDEKEGSLRHWVEDSARFVYRSRKGIRWLLASIGAVIIWGLAWVAKTWITGE